MLAVRADHLLVALEAHTVGSTDLPSRHLAVADAARGIDEDLRCEALSSAGIEAVIAGNAEVLTLAAEGLRELRALEDLSAFAREEAEATLGIILVLCGASDEGASTLRATGQRRLEARPDDQAHVIEALIWVEELDLAERLSRRVMSLARHDGGPFTLTSAHWAEGLRLMRIGDWDDARTHLVEAFEVCEATEHVGQHGILRASLAVLDAARGAFSIQESDDIERVALRHGFAGVAEYLGAAAGMMEFGAGRGAAAAVHFERARAWKRGAGQVEPCVGSWPADLVDAYLLAGERAQASRRSRISGNSPTGPSAAGHGRRSLGSRASSPPIRRSRPTSSRRSSATSGLANPSVGRSPARPWSATAGRASSGLSPSAPRRRHCGVRAARCEALGGASPPRARRQSQWPERHRT